MCADLKVIAQSQVNEDRTKRGTIGLQMLVRQLLEVVQDLFLDYGRQTLHLLHQDALVHLNLTEVTVCALPTD